MLVLANSRGGNYVLLPTPRRLGTRPEGRVLVMDKSGLIGRPSLATAEKGELVLGDLAVSFNENLRLLLG